MQAKRLARVLVTGVAQAVMHRLAPHRAEDAVHWSVIGAAAGLFKLASILHSASNTRWAWSMCWLP